MERRTTGAAGALAAGSCSPRDMPAQRAMLGVARRRAQHTKPTLPHLLPRFLVSSLRLYSLASAALGGLAARAASAALAGTGGTRAAALARVSRRLATGWGVSF